MVHKANVVYIISIILLLLVSSKLVIADVSENPKHNDAEKMISRLRLQMKIIHVAKVIVPLPPGPSSK
ncbi:hypothetical protein C1H46_011727 [Malus baccata]|uniref:Transmembrane protein n=1 Tax=Malus baccata TaxID=106549 RepID=A0A540MV71_MALBA|nr:hypothetical protein C1H46_011727 [Malus baccata]